jgi:hypothetical protein
MAANARSSGSKLVVAAVVGTFSAVGIGTIYLPFFADRDEIRGMHEEKGAPPSAMLAQEIKKLQKEGLLKGDAEHQVNIPESKRAAGSMWKNMK